MKRYLFVIVFALLIGFCLILAACGNTEVNTAEETGASDAAEEEDTSSSFETVEVEETETPTFEEANILTYELAKRDDESYKEIISTFKVTNNGSVPLDYVSMEFSYLDENGNMICDDGRFCRYQILPGKSILLKSYSHLDDKEKSLIKDIVPTEYRYIMGDLTYEVNLQTESVDIWDSYEKPSDVDFDKVNILSFDYESLGNNSSGTLKIEVHINNNGSIPVTYSNYDMAYLDENQNLLTKDGRFCDDLINPGNFVTSTSYGDPIEETLSPIKSYGIYSYEYRLLEPDEYGFNYYEINLQNKTAEGFFSDK